MYAGNFWYVLIDFTHARYYNSGNLNPDIPWTVLGVRPCKVLFSYGLDPAP